MNYCRFELCVIKKDQCGFNCETGDGIYDKDKFIAAFTNVSL